MYEIKNFIGELNGKLNKREKFLVLDVEGYSTARPYNIGYIVADKYGTIYVKRSIALPSCFWENIESMLRTKQAEEMTKRNIEEILKDVDNKRTKRKYKSIAISEFFALFERDISLFNIKKMFSYNVTFDKSALSRLYGDNFTKLNLEFCDIITAILDTKLLTKKYVNWCIENGYISEKGNILTKAEVVYRYLSNDLTFIEEHTGLSDCMIEYEILLTAFETHKKLNFKPCQAWRVLKKFATENGITIPIPTV